MQFIIWAPSDDTNCFDANCLQRDMSFRFSEIGGYKSFSNSLSASSSVSPQSIVFVPTLNKLAIPDGISTGLLLFDLDRLVVSDSFQ